MTLNYILYSTRRHRSGAHYQSLLAFDTEYCFLSRKDTHFYNLLAIKFFECSRETETEMRGRKNFMIPEFLLPIMPRKKQFHSYIAAVGETNHVEVYTDVSEKAQEFFQKGRFQAKWGRFPCRKSRAEKK